MIFANKTVGLLSVPISGGEAVLKNFNLSFIKDNWYKSVLNRIIK